MTVKESAKTRQFETLPTEYRVMATSFRRSLLATNSRSGRSVESYGDAVRLFGVFLVEMGMPTDVIAIASEHVEKFIADQLAHWKPATLNNRFRGLQQFFNWLVEEGEIVDSPIRRMKPPRIPEESPRQQ